MSVAMTMHGERCPNERDGCNRSVVIAVAPMTYRPTTRRPRGHAKPLASQSGSETWTWCAARATERVALPVLVLNGAQHCVQKGWGLPLTRGINEPHGGG